MKTPHLLKACCDEIFQNGLKFYATLFCGTFRNDGTMADATKMKTFVHEAQIVKA